MPISNREAAYIWDMLQAARRIQEFTAGLSYEEYLESILIQSAVERQLEILGEACRRMSEEFRQEHPEIPWSGIIAQRNVIAHQYDEIIQEQLWSVVNENLPVLIAQLEPLIPPLPPEIE
jgi:uncharacterized protein with HEPN domain